MPNYCQDREPVLGGDGTKAPGHVGRQMRTAGPGLAKTPKALSITPCPGSLPWPDFRAVCQDPGQGGVQREEEQAAVGQGRIQEASGRIQVIPKVSAALGRVGKLGFVI